MHLTSLPDEILVRSSVRAIADRMQCYIASFLELKHVRALALTCTHTHAVTSDPALWREFYLRRWRGRDWPELENVPWKFRYERRLKEVHTRVTPILAQRPLDRRSTVPNVLNFLREEGHIGLTPECAAKYLAAVKVDPLSLGLFLAQSMEVCKLYVAHTIPLTQLEVDEAFRALLRRIIIPSESQHLNRIISGFASAYYQANSSKSCYPCDEAVYIITFTVVVLNVDLHSPMVTNKMKKDSWIQLVRASLDHSNIQISPDVDALLSRVWERTVSQSLNTPPEPACW